MNSDLATGSETIYLKAVPLFPLPNVVLFPNALLPLHIFEERYKAMTSDALEGDRQIAMALLSPGWESRYADQPAIEPVVCVGRILRADRLADGKFNLLLRGEVRAHVEEELQCGGSQADAPLYRRAHLSIVPETSVMEIDLSPERKRLETLLTDSSIAKLPLAVQVRSLLRSAMKTADIADLVAFHFLDSVPSKQLILGDGDIGRRINRLLSYLNCLELPADDQFLLDPATLSSQEASKSSSN